jgi:signal transduction histidine kinase
MRIRSKVALVGGIPIVIAAAIAAIAFLLLGEAGRTREGAVVAGAVYRDLLGAMTERDAYIRAPSGSRGAHLQRFTEATASALQRLDSLTGLSRDRAHREMIASTRRSLQGYRSRMGDLVAVTERNDSLIADIGERASSLIALTDQARERQHASNTDIVASLTDGDRKLRVARDVVDRAHELRAAITALWLQEARAESPRTGDTGEGLGFGLARLRNAANDLLQLLNDDGREASARELRNLVLNAETQSTGAGSATAVTSLRDRQAHQRLADWVERLIKVHSTEQRAQQEELAQLLTYSVAAAETEQVTQNIAITSLRLGLRTAEALATRDTAAANQILADSATLATTVASLPISPLIQSEMIEAIKRWREGLATTAQGLREQNVIIADMNNVAAALTRGADTLDSLFTTDAERIGGFVRTILLLGAAIGLLLGASTALIVARSITEPLKRLKDGMLELAADPQADPIADSARRDELGAIARAANFFVSEIRRREDALRHAKDRADTTLSELRETQSNLIQAEKLASLGQLVAGVAHEINTPLGVALTTSTALEREVKTLDERATSGRLARSEFSGAMARLAEGSQLLLSNLTRAIDLVYSFKQVAADQASGDRRQFEMRHWLDELLTSLGPALRKGGHGVSVSCPPDLVLDTYPGSLAQVLTNLVMNAITHAYPAGQSGHLAITVTPLRLGAIRLTFTDDGRGIAPEHRAKVFDPFFTTGRDRGSTGLGLHIVYNLVTVKLQGSIDLASEVGRGTRFTIDLPLSVVDTEAEPAVPPLARAS